MSILAIRRKLQETAPLIHCITNPISINQCANAILAVGARPMMAEHPKEVGEITPTAAGLLLNLGNITDVRMESISLAAQAAKERNIPMVLDAVGIACSSLRRAYVGDLLEKVTPTVIKGNFSEINALYHQAYRASGVDADGALTVEGMDRVAMALARKHRTIILASGAVDIVTDGTALYHVKNGTTQLATITGTGCMLGALCAACLSVEPDIRGAVAACAMLGVCGELAQTPKGPGSFFLGLMDQLAAAPWETIENAMNVEEVQYENL